MFEQVARFLRQTNASQVVPTDAPPDVPPLPQLPFRPRVGIALGGGSARGWAHIGVLKALADEKVEVDVVAGTSIGALVGGCWLGGRLPELEDFARAVTKRRMLQLMDFSLSGKGLIGGNRLGALLNEHLGEARVQDLPKAFTAVATELGTGHEIWLSSGSLVEAMRASYCLPGVFTPIRVGGRWLVDGALVNPVPVSVCRALGARLVIAVNLGTDTFGRGTVIHHTAPPNPVDHLPDMVPADIPPVPSRFRLSRPGGTDGLPGIPGVMMEAFNIIQDRITRARLAGDPPDVTIGPRLGRIGLFDFHRASEAIEAGYEAGRRQVAEIRELAAALA